MNLLKKKTVSNIDIPKGIHLPKLKIGLTYTEQESRYIPGTVDPILARHRILALLCGTSQTVREKHFYL